LRADLQGTGAQLHGQERPLPGPGQGKTTEQLFRRADAPQKMPLFSIVKVEYGHFVNCSFVELFHSCLASVFKQIAIKFLGLNLLLSSFEKKSN
jgi:hypothetical protein